MAEPGAGQAEHAAGLALAQRAVGRMLEHDAATRLLGMLVVELAPGRAVVEMTIRPEILNGFALCHGGLLVALADSALAFASNGGNELTLTAGLSIEFIAPARLGDTVRATAQQAAGSGRSMGYDVVLANQHGAVLALVRGRAARTGKPVVEELPAAGADRPPG